jgi:hypothetical protein
MRYYSLAASHYPTEISTNERKESDRDLTRSSNCVVSISSKWSNRKVGKVADAIPADRVCLIQEARVQQGPQIVTCSEAQEVPNRGGER